MPARPRKAQTKPPVPKQSASKPHVPKRGRPSVAQVAAIDRAIVAAACDLFFAEGFDAVAMEQIAARAPVSKGTLYARYPSKEALFVAVISALVKEWSARASQQDHLLSDDIEQRLRHHARTIAASLQEPDVQAMQRLIVSIRGRFPELAQAMHDHGYAYITGIIVGDLTDDAARRGQTLRDPASVARTLVSGLAGYDIQNQDPDGLAPFAERLVDLLMAAREVW